MKNKDLTVGNPYSVLWRFCIPLFASVIFQQLYNIADSLVAGKFLGEIALAAVGNSYEITLIFIAVGFGCNIGCSVVSAQLFGGKRFSELKTAVYTAFIACAFICVALVVFGVFCGDFMLGLINTPNDIFSDSSVYLAIYSLGIPFVFYYNIATGIFSALGDSKTPFVFLAASSTANVVADIIFVKAFGLGVEGLAWATFICQGISCVLSVIFLLKRLKGIETEGKARAFSWRLLGKISAVAVPSMIQQSFISVGNIVIQGVINGFGSGVVAGYAAAIKLNNLVTTSLTTLGNGVSSFTAQNLGAGKPNRIRLGYTYGLLLAGIVSLPIVCLYVFFREPLINVFLNEPTLAAMDAAKAFLLIVAPFYLIIAVKIITDGVLRGAGMMLRFMCGTLLDLFLRVALAIVFSKIDLGSTGIWLAWPFGWTLSTGLSLLFYFTAKAFRKNHL
ncbi:MAG: MATE family efflux transporter [Clostridia bacterium]|nr:MATE family efflux transporter [Clostridia bacterium]